LTNRWRPCRHAVPLLIVIVLPTAVVHGVFAAGAEAPPQAQSATFVNAAQTASPAPSPMPLDEAAAKAERATRNARRFHLLTLIPPLAAILLSFLTRNVVLSLFLGVLSGTFILGTAGAHPLAALLQAFFGAVDLMVTAVADPWHAGILCQTLTIGGLIALVARMGGAQAVAESLARRARTPRSAQFVTLGMGILVFFDDYANALIVGPIMRPVTDKLRISREKLAFIVDATAAPVAGIALISTWIGYELGVIRDAYRIIGEDVNAYGVFVQTVPFRFYNLLILAFIFFTALFLREFGPMLRAERRARTTGKVLADHAKPMVSEEILALAPPPEVRLSVWNAILPIGTLLLTSLAGFYYNGYTAILGGKDAALAEQVRAAPLSFLAIREAFSASNASIVLFQSALFASIVAMALGIGRRILSVSVAVDTFIQGMKSLLITCVILILAWALSGVVNELGTANYIVALVSGSIPAFALPALIFLLGSIISFATGTSYGTMGILMPLAAPLAYAIAPEPGYVIMCVGGVLTGAIFGDHCSPISDTTILSSMGSACDHMDHTNTQLWYAVAVALVALVFGYIPVGLGLSVWLALPIGLVATCAVVYFVGKPVEEASPAVALQPHLAEEE